MKITSRLSFVFPQNPFQEDLTKETLVKQFKIVKKHTNTSHVQQFGNKVWPGSLCSSKPWGPAPK